MYTQILPHPIRESSHDQWYAQFAKFSAWLTALLLAGIAFPLWKSLMRLAFEKLYEIFIMGRY